MPKARIHLFSFAGRNFRQFFWLIAKRKRTKFTWKSDHHVTIFPLPAKVISYKIFYPPKVSTRKRNEIKENFGIQLSEKGFALFSFGLVQGVQIPWSPPPETKLENIEEKGLYHMKVYASVILRMYVWYPSDEWEMNTLHCIVITVNNYEQQWITVNNGQ